jgi:FtsP/CotA-like multicopper oxidase with cupredoxin domain
MSDLSLSRRKFLALAGVAGAGLTLAACTTQSPAAGATVADGRHGRHAAAAADDMDALHKQGVETFVAGAGKDTTFWRPPLEFKLDGEFKVFEITCTQGQWNVAPDQAIDGMMYNGMIPGPEIRVTEGDKVRVICKNEMTQSTSIHFHGVLVSNSMDGVPFITQDPITPGGSFTYEFTARNPGSHSTTRTTTPPNRSHWACWARSYRPKDKPKPHDASTRWC